ncbi:hypothetical protein Trydic_g22702 [Trypoxylus dichotomus]
MLMKEASQQHQLTLVLELTVTCKGEDANPYAICHLSLSRPVLYLYEKTYLKEEISENTAVCSRNPKCPAYTISFGNWKLYRTQEKGDATTTRNSNLFLYTCITAAEEINSMPITFFESRRIAHKGFVPQGQSAN